MPKRGHIIQSQMPSYIELREYIYGQGVANAGGWNQTNCYLDTGILADNTTEIECRFRNTDTNPGMNYFGVRDPNFAVGGFESARKFGCITSWAGNQTFINWDNNIHTFILGDQFIIDDTVYLNYGTRPTFLNSLSIWFFASNRTQNIGGLAANASGYLYSAIIRKNGNLVFDGRPMHNTVTNRYGVYDMISGNEFYALGGREFLANE